MTNSSKRPVVTLEEAEAARGAFSPIAVGTI